MRATLTSKGQTTIPKGIRDHLHLVEGDKLDFVIESDGQVVLKPGTLDVSELKGILRAKTQGKMISLEEMDRAILKGAKGSSR